MGNKSSITKTINTNRVDNTSSSSMSNLGSIHSRYINRDYSTISMGHQTMWVSSIVVWIPCIVWVGSWEHCSSKMSSSGKGNFRSVSRHYSSIGVGHQSSG